MLERLQEESFDLVVVGGGATGLGVALDAALRGLSVALIEAHDFAKGTSSRATKLVHGGVRYLAQGRIALVREALRERSALLRNAPELVRPLPFVMPAYRFWEIPFYAAGLALYDALAGRDGLGPTRMLGRRRTQDRLPGLRREGLKGGIEYWDAQFDDARLALALARAAEEQGAVVLNYVRATDLVHEQGRLAGVHAQDAETGRRFVLRSRCVVNATGVWTDALRRLDARASGRSVRGLIRASRGAHLVVDRSFLPTDRALLVPRTGDGRVLFAVPWLGKVLLGTTDVATDELTSEPHPDEAEVEYILREAGRYLSRPPTRKDVRSAWAGLRPLVDPQPDRSEGRGKNHPVATRRISREHFIEISPSGLVTVAGGKWTTYRAMAQDVLDACVRAGLLAALPPCSTRDFALTDALGPFGHGIIPLPSSGADVGILVGSPESGAPEDRASVDRASVDRNSVDRNSVDRSSVDRNSVDRNSVDRDSVDRDSADRDSADRDSADRDSADRDSADRDSGGEPAAGGVDQGEINKGELDEDELEALRPAGLSPAMIRHAARHAYARRVEDVLARRSRLLFLDAALAAKAAPAVARVLQSETGVDAALDDFLELARRYGLTA